MKIYLDELGMEPEELLKLKHITGFSKLFKDFEYKKAWGTRRQIKFRLKNQLKEEDRVSGLGIVEIDDIQIIKKHECPKCEYKW